MSHTFKIVCALIAAITALGGLYYVMDDHGDTFITKRAYAADIDPYKCNVAKIVWADATEKINMAKAALKRDPNDQAAALLLSSETIRLNIAAKNMIAFCTS